MKIQGVAMRDISTPLIKPFKTALRVLSVADTLVVEMRLDDGRMGFGAATPTAAITGDTLGSIRGAIEILAPQIIGMDIREYEAVLARINSGIVRNNSAKAALDMAVYDLVSQIAGMPLYRFLGGVRGRFETDITVSINPPAEMAEDAKRYVGDGFSTLKVKVGLDARLDLVRVRAVREAVGSGVKLRLDANQGWRAKEAIAAIRTMEDAGLDIELVEQPVKAGDIEGLKLVTDSVSTPIMADETVFTPEDALQVITRRAADMINIKLMKAGGIYNALKINALAESAGMECMIGCMVENKIGITAASHLAGAKRNITRMDLDAPFLLTREPIEGGISFEGAAIVLPDAPGLGIRP